MEIEKLIQDQIADIDYKYLVVDEIRRSLTADIKREIHAVIKTRVEELLNLEIDIVMSGKVFTDDGWGKKNTFNSFEDLFKATLKAKLDSSYDMKRLLEKKVKERVSALFENNKNAVVERVVDEMTKSKIVK